MNEYITLVGAEDVQRAGAALRSAAETMQRAASSIEDSLHRHRLFLDDWLERFECTLKEND